jgi:general secretion pathway protein C
MPQSITGFKWGDLRLSSADLHAVKYRPFLILLTMTLMAYLVVGIFYKVLSLSLIKTQVGPVSVESVVKKEIAAREPVESFKVIVERNLFGSTDKIFAAKQSADKAPPAPDFSTLYDLRGTVAGDSRYGFAILEEKSGRKQRLYKVGDAIGGGRIAKILRNSIVVKIGEEEKIMKIAETREAPILPPSGVAGQPAPPVSTPAVSASGSMTVNRGDVTDGLKDIGTMLSQAQIRPYFSMGAPDGFLVTNIRPGSIYQKMGIANGDIIQGVNDKNIRTADDMMAFYNTLKGSSNVTINIKRQGRQEKLNYVFK